MAMTGVLCALAFCLQLTYAFSSSPPTFGRFSNSTTNVTPSSTITSSTSITSSSSLPAVNNDLNSQNCSMWPLEFKTGYWSSLNLPVTTIGTIFYIVNETTNSTSTSTEFSSEIIVTERQSASASDSSANIRTLHGSDLISEVDVLTPTATKSDTIRLVDGSWTTLTYPNGVLDVTDSFYWRGSVTYLQEASTLTASNTGPFSAPGYLQWGWDEDAWLPPSPLPGHEAWPASNQTLDLSDPFGLRHVFIRGDECDYDYDYLMGCFAEAPITAVVDICTPPPFKCRQDMFSWVTTVQYLLETSVISTGQKPASAKPFQNVEETPKSDQTVNPQPTNSTPRTGGNYDNTHTPTKQTPAPGSPVPTTPKQTKTPKQTGNTEPTYKPSPENTHNSDPRESVEKPTGGRVHTKTNSAHQGGQESSRNTKHERPGHTLRPTNGPTPQPIIRIGTETATRNSDSGYVLSGTTLAPGTTVTLGSGPSATTVAMSTQGKNTWLVVNGESTKLPPATQPTDTSEVLIGSKTLSAGGSVVVSGTTYSLAPGGSTIFVDGHPEGVTLNEKISIATLSNGVVVTETEVGGISSEAATTSRPGGGQNSATTYVATSPEILLGSKTLSAGSSVVVSGTTYSLGGRGSVLYIDGEPTKIPWADGSSLITLPNGVVATEVALTTTVISSPSSTQGASSSVQPASNVGHIVSMSWAVLLNAAICIVFSIV